MGSNKKPAYNQNPITQDTVKFICLWHKEGDSIMGIAACMGRNERDVENILMRARKSGYYEKISKECAEGFHGLKMKKKGDAIIC